MHYGRIAAVQVVQCVGDLKRPSVAQLGARLLAQDRELGGEGYGGGELWIEWMGVWRRDSRQKCPFRPGALFSHTAPALPPNPHNTRAHKRTRTHPMTL